MALYESNLEELSKEALVAMVKLYRKKEKMWKEDKLQIVKSEDDPGTSVPIPSKTDVAKKPLDLDSPSKSGKKNAGSSPEPTRPMSARIMGKGGQEHPKRHSTSALTKQFRVATPTTVPNKKLEKAAKERGQNFIDAAYERFKGTLPLGSNPLPTERPSLTDNKSTEKLPESKTAQLQHFIQQGQNSLKEEKEKPDKSHSSLHFAVPTDFEQFKKSFEDDNQRVKTAGPDEINSRLDPDKNVFLINTEEALAESPYFHRHVVTAEQNVDSFMDELKSFADAGDHAADMAYRATVAMEGFATTLFRMKNQMGEFGNGLVSNTLNRYAELLAEMQELNREIASDMMKLVVVPVRTYIDEETESLAKLSREYKKKSEQYDKVLTNHMKRVTETDFKEDDELANSREQLFDAALFYVSRFNEIEVSGKLNFVAAITSFVHHTTEFTAAQHRLFEPALPFLKTFGSYINKSKNTIATRLPKLTSKTGEKKDAKGKVRRGYLFWANKVQKNKPQSWKRAYFTIDPGSLTQVTFENDNVQKKQFSLLTTSVKPRRDVDRQLVFEVTCMVADPDQPEKMHPESLILQAETPQLYQSWMTVIQSGIMDSLVGQQAPEETNKKQTTRIKLPDTVQNQIASMNPKCADCNQEDPEWAAINLGVLVCIECSGVHRHLGVTISKVRSITLDKWDVAAYKLLLQLGNSRVNSVLEDNLRFQTDYNKLSDDAPRAERDRFINAKYKERKFMKEDLGNKDLHSIVRKGQPIEVLTMILRGADVNARDKDLLTPLHKAVKAKRPLIAQLLISNGAEVDARGGEEEDTPLHIAARNQDAECIAVLVSSGSASPMTNAAGKLPIDLCESAGEFTTELKKAFEGFDPSMLAAPSVEKQTSSSDVSDPIREESHEDSSDREKDSRPDSDGEREKSTGSSTKRDLGKKEESSSSSKRDTKEEKASDEGSRRPSMKHQKSKSEETIDKNKRSPSSIKSTKSATASSSPTSVSSGSSKTKIKVTSVNLDDDKKSSLPSSREESNDSSVEEKPATKSILPEPKIQAPKVAQVSSSLSLTPRESAVGVVKLSLSSPYAIVGEAVTITTSEIKNRKGDVLKGHKVEYEVDIMGATMVDGEVENVKDDGSFQLKFTPTAAGKYFVQVYLNDVPLFGEYYEVTARSAEEAANDKKKKK